MNSRDFLYVYGEKKQESFISEIDEIDKSLADLLKEEKQKLENENHKITGKTIQDSTSPKPKTINSIKSSYKKKRHNLFVQTCLAPRAYLSGDDEVYAFINEIETIDDVNYITISLVTPQMAYTDNEFFGENYRNQNDLWKSEYRPYYYEFSTVLNTKDSMLVNEYYFQNEWFRARLVRSEKDKQLMYSNCVTKPAIGDYVQGVVNFGGSESFSDVLFLVFESELIKDSVRKGLADLYSVNLNQQQSPDAYLKTTFGEHKDKYSVNVLNVGQANCIHIKNIRSNASMFFDIGRPLKGYKTKSGWVRNADLKSGKSIVTTLGLLDKYKPDCIIISHWHSDHFAAYIHLRDIGKGKKWIVPPITKKTITSAIRLIRFLIKKHKNDAVYCMKDCEYVYDNMHGFQIWKGNPINGDLNSGSYIMRINSALFAGDCLYEFWPPRLRKNLQNVTDLVVPHHGSSLDKRKCCSATSISVIQKFDKSKKKRAYVCVGSNGYGHPDTVGHLQELQNQGFDIVRTDVSSQVDLKFIV